MKQKAKLKCYKKAGPVTAAQDSINQKNAAFAEWEANRKKNASLVANDGGKESKINYWLGNPKGKSQIEASPQPEWDPNSRKWLYEEPIDNIRHANAGRYTAEAIANKTGNIPYVSKALGYLGSNALGISHEVGTYFTDPRWSESGKSFTDKAKVITQEAAEDIYNNNYGAIVGSTNMSPLAKSLTIKHANWDGRIPDGQGEAHPFKDNPNWTDPYSKKKTGGLIFHLKKGGNVKGYAGAGTIESAPIDLSTQQAQPTKPLYSSTTATQPAFAPFEATQQDRTTWNDYQDYAKKQPDYGQPIWDTDVTHGQKSLDAYNLNHPESSIRTPADVARVQTSLTSLNQNPQQFSGNSRIFPAQSLNVDSVIGTRTSAARFPKITQENQQLHGTATKEFGTDYESYSKEQPTWLNSPAARAINKQSYPDSRTDTISGWKMTYKKKGGTVDNGFTNSTPAVGRYVSGNMITPTRQDSLDLYNFTQLQKKLEQDSDRRKKSFIEKNFGNSPNLTPQGIKDQAILKGEAIRILKNNPNLKSGLYNSPIKPSVEDYGVSYDIYHPKIKPKGVWWGIALNNDYTNVKPSEQITIQQNKTVSKLTPQLKTVKKVEPKLDTSNWEQSSLDSLRLSNTRAYLPVHSNDPFIQSEIDDIIKNNRVYGSNIFDDPKNRRAAARISATGDEYNIKPIWTKVGNKYVQTFKKPVGVQKKVEPKVETQPVTTQPVQNETPVETAVERKPKNAISYEPETTNVGGGPGQYVHYDSQGNAHVITEQEYKRLEGKVKHYTPSWKKGGAVKYAGAGTVVKNIDLKIPQYKQPDKPLFQNRMFAVPLPTMQNSFVAGERPSININNDLNAGLEFTKVHIPGAKIPLEYGVNANYQVNPNLNVSGSIKNNGFNVGFKKKFAGGGGIEYADSKFWEDRPVQKKLHAPGYADGNVVRYTKEEHIPFVKENEGTALETWRAPNKYQFTQPVPEYTKNPAPQVNTPTGGLNLSSFKMPDINLPKMQVNSSKGGATYLNQIGGWNEPEHLFNMGAGLGVHHQFKGPLGIDVGIDTDALATKGLEYWNKSQTNYNATSGVGTGLLTRASASINPSVGFKGSKFGLYGNARVASNYLIPTISSGMNALVSSLPNGGSTSTGTQKIDTYGKIGAGIYYNNPFGWQDTRLKVGPVLDYDFQTGKTNPSFRAELNGSIHGEDYNLLHLGGAKGSLGFQIGGGEAPFTGMVTLAKPINSKSKKYMQPNTNYKNGGKIKFKPSLQYKKK